MAKRVKVVFTAAAKRDLKQISVYLVDQVSPDFARKTVTELGELAESLRQFPERGNVPKELDDIGIHEFRQLVRSPYRLFYHFADDTVAILLIADGRRDIPALLHQRLLK